MWAGARPLPPGRGVLPKCSLCWKRPQVLVVWKSCKGKSRKGVRHRRQTQGLQAKPGPPPCFTWPSTLFLPGSSTSSRLTVKEQLHLYSPQITFGPLKATWRLMWPPVKMSLTPLVWGTEGAYPEQPNQESPGRGPLLALCVPRERSCFLRSSMGPAQGKSFRPQGLNT